MSATPPPLLPDALAGDLVRLRPAVEGDIDRILDANSDWEGIRLSAGGPPLPFHRSWVETWVTKEFGWDRLMFVIDPLDPDLPVAGHVALGNFSFPEAEAWLGMGLHADSRGRGFGTDALRVMCGYAFDQLNLHRVSLGTWAFNFGGQALYPKVGFVEEGREREYVYRDGAYHDSILYSMLAHEWREHRGHPS